MRAVVQRVQKAAVQVDSHIVGQIDAGLLIFLGISREDKEPQATFLAEKVCHLRIFNDEEGKMNRSLLDVNGSALIVSQFTLYGDCRKGRRPSFADAAPPEIALPLYEFYCKSVRDLGVHVATGIFQADMLVSLENDGPVTLILEA